MAHLLAPGGTREPHPVEGLPVALFLLAGLEWLRAEQTIGNRDEGTPDFRILRDPLMADEYETLARRLDALRVDLLILRDGVRVPMPTEDIDRHLATVDDAAEASRALAEMLKPV